MTPIVVVYAHPYPRRSRGCAALLSAIRAMEGLQVRSLYELYPDFDIDRRAEQAALREAATIVWMHPLYWYGPPGMLKHWFDKVLLEGFAFGDRGRALQDKACLWVTTTGGGEYARGGVHDHPFADFAPPLEMTARYCGMRWLDPFVVHDVAHRSDEELLASGQSLRERLAAAGSGD